MKRTFGFFLPLILLASCAPAVDSSTPASEIAAQTAPSGTLSAGLTSADFSSLSYTEAFDRVFAIAETQYAFNGVEGKQPDWDALKSAIRPRIIQAESNHDAQAYFLALRDFTLAFRDGNVNLGGGDIQVGLFQAETEGGYGLALRELGDGRVIVTSLTPGGPAESAGIQVGAQVTSFNGRPISEAIEATRIWGAPPSLESTMRYQQLRYLTRARRNTSAVIVYVNPGGSAATATLVAIAERESFAATSYFLHYDPNAPPVESRLLASGAGYVKFSSTSDNPELISSLFEAALRDFSQTGAPGLVIDLRVVANLAAGLTGPVGLAGYLSDAPIPLGQLQFFDAKTGKFEDEGSPSFFAPRASHFSFGKIILLVGPGCSGLCELEAYALAQLPGATVIGQYPSAGTYADATRGQFLLPEGFKLQIPTGRFVLPDGSLLIEGQGIPLTIRVLVDEATVLSATDAVLEAAEAQFK